MRSAEGALPLRHAVALGLLQGPCELLPVSSSAHTQLVPWLARWPYAELDGERRKSFEVALHAGAGAALAIHMRRELLREARRLDPRRASVVALSLAPPALVGYTFGRPIERRLGGPRSIAAGLVLGAVAMALADARAGQPQRGERGFEEATPRDGLALGLAQAAALIPGVSRNGGTLATARARGFTRAGAQALSWHAGLPVIFGAGVLKGMRLCRRGLAREQRASSALGGGAAFLSTLAGARLLRRPLSEGQALLPYSLYRCALAALVISRLPDRATANAD
jgi:undecaprenyl-diphosphatase